MSKTVKIDQPSLGEDVEVEIPGLGVFKNGTHVDVTDEQVEAYESFGNKWPDTEMFLITDEDRPVQRSVEEVQADSDLAALETYERAAEQVPLENPVVNNPEPYVAPVENVTAPVEVPEEAEDQDGDE